MEQQLWDQQHSRWRSALSSNTTGSNNTALGYNTFQAGTAFANSTALGANAVMTLSNKNPHW